MSRGAFLTAAAALLFSLLLPYTLGYAAASLPDYRAGGAVPGLGGLVVPLDIVLPPHGPKPSHENSSIQARQISAEGPRPGYHETSEYMIGSVAVSLIIVESNGAVDADTESWSPMDIEEAAANVRFALEWWEEQAKDSRVPLRFSLRLEGVVETSYEPSRHPVQESVLWISEVLRNLGYPAGRSAEDTLYDHANRVRRELQTDWAVIIFLVKDFSGNWFGGKAGGFARLGGPEAAVIHSRLQTFNRIAIAHEIGHLFWATHEGDEKVSGYLGARASPSSGCLMEPRGAQLCLTPGTELQVGWRDSDGDGIPDIIDTTPTLRLTDPPPRLTDRDQLTLRGFVRETPYPNQNPFGGRDVTINKIGSVNYRLAGGKVELAGEAMPRDGRFDSALEGFEVRLPLEAPGRYAITLEAVNSVGGRAAISDETTYTYVVIMAIEGPGRERVDVGSPQRIAVSAVWAHNQTPVGSGRLQVAGSWLQIESGTASAEFVFDTPGPRAFEVTAADVAGIRRVESRASPIMVTWDQVVVELEVGRARIDVGGRAEIGVQARYAVGGEAFVGTITLNDDTFTQPHVGARSYRAAAVMDEKYGLTAFTSNEVSVVFDRVEVTLKPVKDRVDVGSRAELAVEAFYAYDAALFMGEVRLNGSLTRDSVGRSTYAVEAISDPLYGLTAFAANTADIIFDRVVLSLQAPPGRVDTGTLAPLRWEGFYEYDGSPFRGQVTLNLPLVQERVGRYEYTVVGIEDPAHGLSAFAANRVPVVFDRVEIRLEAAQERIDVGNEAPITVEARYQYDGSPYDGAVILSEDLRQERVGRYEYTVAKIAGGRYNLTRFESNRVGVVFDRVEVMLEAPLGRVEVGRSAPVEYRARYAYDGSPLQGEITLNATARQAEVGRYRFAVESVRDERYGLSAFVSNTVEVIFDRITAREQAAEGLAPGSATISLRLSYAFDGAPVDDAAVRVEGASADNLGGGWYRVSVPTWMPYLTLRAEVERPGFDQTLTLAVYPPGNLLLWSAALGLAGAASLGWLRDRRARS